VLCAAAPWAIIEAPAKGWTSGWVIGAGLASLAVLSTFVVWEARSRHPMLKLGFAVALGGVVVVLARLPSRVSRDSPDPSVRVPTNTAP
jgi:hypothetical protein